jgi:hypothetical protein
VHDDWAISRHGTRSAREHDPYIIVPVDKVGELVGVAFVISDTLRSVKTSQRRTIPLPMGPRIPRPHLVAMLSEGEARV